MWSNQNSKMWLEWPQLSSSPSWAVPRWPGRGQDQMRQTRETQEEKTTQDWDPGLQFPNWHCYIWPGAQEWVTYSGLNSSLVTRLRRIKCSNPIHEKIQLLICPFPFLPAFFSLANCDAPVLGSETHPALSESRHGYLGLNCSWLLRWLSLRLPITFSMLWLCFENSSISYRGSNQPVTLVCYILWASRR